jgi:DNA helicase-2/ATP-dependent DNA helicase PcrA
MALSNFGVYLNNWRTLTGELSPLKLMDRILGDINYQEFLDDGTEEGRDRWDNVMELRRLAAEYDGKDLTAFLEDVALVSDQDTLNATVNAPTLLTLHAAKGLEFPYIFIVGLEDGTLPHIRSFEDPEAMAEERRLFYVGITRAQDRLFLLHALNRSAYGYTEPTEASRFLNDIPFELLNGDHPSISRRRPRLSRLRLDSWQAAGRNAAPILQPSFRAGNRVAHPSWGEGMVLNSVIQDDDEIVDIFFESVGLKRVAASLAKLERKE